MILTRSNNSTVELNGDVITKTFTNPLAFMVEAFAYDFLGGVAAPVTNIDRKNMIITMPKLLTWREVTLTDDQKYDIALHLIDKLRTMWNAGYVFGDIHMDNVVLRKQDDGYIPYLIDFEWLHPRISDKFETDIDMVGFHSVSAFDGSYRSLKHVLDVTKEDVL